VACRIGQPVPDQSVEPFRGLRGATSLRTQEGALVRGIEITLDPRPLNARGAGLVLPRLRRAAARAFQRRRPAVALRQSVATLSFRRLRPAAAISCAAAIRVLIDAASFGETASDVGRL
jgi:hypothetical protein